MSLVAYANDDKIIGIFSWRMNILYLSFLLDLNLHWLLSYSYTILAPNVVKNQADPKIATKDILETIALEPELYRLGNTKACLSSKNSLAFSLSPTRKQDITFLWSSIFPFISLACELSVCCCSLFFPSFLSIFNVPSLARQLSIR